MKKGSQEKGSEGSRWVREGMEQVGVLSGAELQPHHMGSSEVVGPTLGQGNWSFS